MMRNILIKLACAGIIGTSASYYAIANYAATQGAGTTFGSLVIGGVHFMSQLFCDATTANQCAAVSAAGAVKVDPSAVTQPVSSTTLGIGTWAAGALGAMATYGTSPGAVLVPGANVFVTNATPGIANNADAIAAVAASSTSPVPVNNYNYVYNGTTWDRVRSVKAGSGIVPVANGGNFYQHIAASQTAAVLQSSAGAAGDYLSHCVIYPTTTAAGSVTVFDNANAAATNVIEFVTGTLSNLAPITIPVGAVSTAGAWKVTTGANETVVCYGKFS